MDKFYFSAKIIQAVMPIFCHKNQKVKYPDLFPYSPIFSKNQSVCLIQSIYSKSMIKANKDLNNSKRKKKRMKETKKHQTKKWEISIMEIEDKEGKKYKVTRRLPEMSVAETKIFASKEKAIKKFNEWLG